ncbi:MAG TPA: hypothetical protein VGB14_00395 [Acidimicrobiales bacterium]|jgi:hypothetical protein
MAEAVAFDIHPTDGEQMLTLWSDAVVRPRGGMVSPEPIDWFPSDDDRAVSLQVTDWLTTSGYVGTARGHARAFGAATEADPTITADQQWRDFAWSGAATGAGYRMNWFGQVENIGGAPAITGQSDVLTPGGFARCFAMDYTSKKHIVASGNGTLFARAGSRIAAGPLPKVTEGWDRIVGMWVDPASWSDPAGQRGYLLDRYGTLFPFGGMDPSSIQLHDEAGQYRDLVVRSADPDPLIYRALDLYGVPHLVVASSPPEFQIVAPRHTVTDTTRPRVIPRYLDAEGDPLASWEFRIFTKAQRLIAGWDAATSPALVEATVLGPVLYYDLTVDLPNGRYIIVGRATDAAGRVSEWYEIDWQQAVVYPSAPPLVVVEDGSVPGPAARLTIGTPVGVGAGRKAIMGGSLTRHAANEAGREQPDSGWDLRYPDSVAGVPVYDGGTLGNWHEEFADRWAALVSYEATTPEPVVWWFQVLLHQDDVLLYTESQLAGFADDLVTAMRGLYDVPIYVSPMPYYEEGTRCSVDDESVQITERIVAHLVADEGCLVGPVMPLVEARLVQETSCHLLDEGRAVQAAVLLAFFAPATAALSAPGVALMAAVPEVDPVDVTVYGASGSFGTWASPLPRAHIGETHAVAGLAQPDSAGAGPPTVAPDGQVVRATSGAPSRMSAPVFDPSSDTPYTVEFPTTTGDLSVSGTTGNGGAPIGRWHRIRSPLGQRLVAFSPQPYSGQNVAADGHLPVMAGLRKKVATGRLVADPKLTFTAADLYDKAVVSLGATDADALFPEATNSHGETYRAVRTFVNSALLADGRHVVVAVQDFPAGGRSGALAVFDVADDPGTAVAYYQLPDMETDGGDLLEQPPIHVAASPVIDADDGQRFSVVYDTAVGADDWPNMAQVFTFDREAGTVEPLTAAFLPVNDFLTGAETYDADFDRQFGRAVWWVDGTLWLTSKGAAGVTPTFASDTHVYCPAGALYTEAEASSGWENRAGVQPTPDTLALPPRSGTNSATADIAVDSASGRVWEVQLGGYVNVYTPESPLLARPELLDNPTFVVDVTGWSSPDGTAGIDHSTDNGGRLVATKAGAGSEAEWESDVVPIPAEFRTGRYTIGAYADVTAVTVARDVRIEVVPLTDALAPAGTGTGPWRPADTVDPHRVHAATLSPSTATQAKVVVRFRGATNGDQIAVDLASLRVAPVTPHDYIDLNVGALASSGSPAVGGIALASARGYAWVPYVETTGPPQQAWLFSIGANPPAFASLTDVQALAAADLTVEVPHYAEIQFSDDDGVTWQPVRDATVLPLSENLFGAATDEELPANRQRLYRLRVWRETPGYVSSEWGPSTGFTLLGVTDAWLSDPTTRGSAVPVAPIDMEDADALPAGVFYADGRPDPIVRVATRQAATGTFPFRTLDKAAHDALRALTADGRPLLLRHVLGENTYFVPLDRSRRQVRAAPRLDEPFPTRHFYEHTVDYVEVARP